MVCSWDERGCVKLLGALESELIDLFFEPRKSSISTTNDGQQMFEQYFKHWKDFSNLIQRVPLAFQQLDLAAKSIMPRPILAPNYKACHGCSRKHFDTPVKSLMQSLWDKFIIETLLEKSEISSIASYCDFLLRSRKYRDPVNDDFAERILAIDSVVSSISDKVTFLRFHKFHIMRRLLLNLPVDFNTEYEFMAIFDKIDGSEELVNQIDRMFIDCLSSEVILRRFYRSLEPIYTKKTVDTDNNNAKQTLTKQLSDNMGLQDNNNQSCINSYEYINIKVLNPKAWRKSIELVDMNLPVSITSVIPSFENFYMNECEGKKLKWCHQLSNGTVEFTSNKGTYELEVTAAQLSILSAFKQDSDDNLISYKELEANSGLPPTDFKRTIKVSTVNL